MFSGVLSFSSPHDATVTGFRFLFDPESNRGNLVLQFTTNSTLLQRAVQDISTVIDITPRDTPTHLIIFTGTDVRKHTNAVV